jgi:curved DNA-binding protein CbpA
MHSSHSKEAQQRESLRNLTHYQVLGVTQNASLDEIRRAFRVVALTAHPDKGGNAEYFRLIKTAWGILKDEGSRKRYDATLQSKPCGGFEDLKYPGTESRPSASTTPSPSVQQPPRH